MEDINHNEHTRVILMCPQGRPFTQEIAQELSEAKHIVFICGHYEGYDERIRKHLVTDEISMGIMSNWWRVTSNDDDRCNSEAYSRRLR